MENDVNKIKGNFYVVKYNQSMNLCCCSMNKKINKIGNFHWFYCKQSKFPFRK